MFIETGVGRVEVHEAGDLLVVFVSQGHGGVFLDFDKLFYVHSILYIIFHCRLVRYLYSYLENSITGIRVGKFCLPI